MSDSWGRSQQRLFVLASYQRQVAAPKVRRPQFTRRQIEIATAAMVVNERKAS